MKKRILELAMTLILLFSAFILPRQGAAVMTSAGVTGAKEFTVVVDAGHGGNDPGKVGVNDALEKDINLNIAKLLEQALAEENIKVVLTREIDHGLYDDGASNKKVQDMQRRAALIDETAPDLVVSIHQNSYSDSSVKGPQVFYYSQSSAGESAANYIQESLNVGLAIESPRSIKSNDSYYLLKNIESTAVIAECGFLSNPEDAENLADESYQEKVAAAICSGIMDYLGK